MGPMLFNIFSSDIDSGIKYILIKFVDDNKLCDKVKMTEGWDATQRDLDSFVSGTRRKLMRFKKSKCKVLHMGNGNQPLVSVQVEGCKDREQPCHNGHRDTSK